MQALVNGLGQAERPHEEVGSADAAVADPAAPVADCVADVAGGKHRLGTVT
jgi:hypothetical protein